MNMKFKIVLTGLATILVAACASAPPQHFASGVEAVQSANRPVFIYQFEAGRVAGNWASHLTRKFSTYAGVAFINTAHAPIQKLAFRLAYYHDDQPVLDANGKPIGGTLVAEGPFVPGSHQAVLGRTPLWVTNNPALHGCARLTGMDVTFEDGRTLVVSADALGQYAAPKLNIHCARYFPSNTAGTGETDNWAGRVIYSPSSP